MFIEQAQSPDNKFWKYIVGTIVVIFASFIGQIPFGIALFFKAASDNVPVPTDTNELLGFLPPNMTLLLMLLAFVAALIGLFIVVKLLHKQSIRSLTTTRPKVDWKRIFFAFGLWSFFIILATVVDYALYPEDYVWNFHPVRFVVLAVIAIIFIPIQTSAEEYMFRAYLMQGIGTIASARWIPLVFTSVTFGLMHISNPEVGKMGYGIMGFYIGTGLLLGIIALMDEGIELALGFHAANNLVGALLVTSDWTAFRTDSILKDISEPGAASEVFLPLLVVYPVLLFIFSKKYGWNNWEEKLTGKIEDHGSTLPQENVGESDIQ